MKKYICHSPAKEEFDCKRNSLGMGTERALYYSKGLGRKRIYRSEYPTLPPIPKGDLTILDFDDIDMAGITCHFVNEQNNDDFKPIELI